MAISTYMKNFSSLMELAGLGSNESFRSFLNDVVKPYMTNIRKTDGFRAMPLKPVYEMNYAVLQEEYRVGVMASHVALDAHARPIGTNPVKVLEGAIPHIAANVTLGADDYRRVAKALHDAEILGISVQETAQKQIFNYFADPKVGMLAQHANRITYMRDQAVGSGKYTITSTNNPGSIALPEIDFKVPGGNKQTLLTTAKWWTDDTHGTEGSASDPLKSIETYLIRKAYEKNWVPGMMEIEIGWQTMHDMLNHSKVREAIGRSVNPMLSSTDRVGVTYGMSEEQRKAAFEGLLGVTFKVNNNIVATESYSATTGTLTDTSVHSFPEDVLVLRPKGFIGDIQSAGNVLPDKGSGIYSLFEDDRMLAEYTYVPREKVQIWDSYETTLMVLTEGINMYYLTVV